VRRNVVPLLILGLALVGLACAYVLFQKSVLPRYEATRGVLARRTVLKIAMRVVHDTGPIVEEDYAMSDVDGVSESTYRVLGRKGTLITIVERPRATLEYGTNVAFFFQEAVGDGVWELRSKPPRGDTTTHYRISVYQVADGAHGSHAFSFTDPHYWATTGGHQFHILLDKNKPVPDLLHLTSTVPVDPRYEKLVAAFRAFGPEGFRAKIAAARERLGART
jgi:hypothetical protein